MVGKITGHSKVVHSDGQDQALLLIIVLIALVS